MREMGEVRLEGRVRQLRDKGRGWDGVRVQEMGGEGRERSSWGGGRVM